MLFNSDGGSPRFVPSPRFGEDDRSSGVGDTPSMTSLSTPSVAALPGPESPAARAHRRRLVHIGSTSDATPDAAAATLAAGRSSNKAMNALAEDRLDETIFKFLSDTTTSAMPQSSLTSRPSWRVSGGVGAATPTLRPPGSTAVARSPHQVPHGQLSHAKDRVRPIALGGDNNNLGEDSPSYARSRNSSVVLLDDTQVLRAGSRPASVDVTTPLTRLPSASPRPPNLGLQPPLHSLLPSPGSPGLLQRQASWRSCGSNGRTSNHLNGSAFSASPSGVMAPTTAPVLSPSEATPSLFPTSNWIKATLNGTATRPRRRTESFSRNPQAPTAAAPTPTPPRRDPNRDKAAAEAATQLHERRVAAALQSQKEMREFTAIMRRVEAEGGASGLRHHRHHKKPQRRMRGGGGGGGGEGGARHGAQGGSRAYPPTGMPPPLARRGGTRLDGGGGGDESGSADDDDDAHSSDAFSDDMDDRRADGDDDAMDAGMGLSLRRGLSATSGARTGGGGGGLGHTSAAAAADLEAAEQMSRVGLYKVRDRTARGWVTLQRRRLAQLRAGTPTLERQMRASHQRLVRANRDGTAMERARRRRSAAEDADRREVARAAITAAAAASGVALASTSAVSSLHLSGAMAEDLATLTVSWSGLRSPEKKKKGAEGREAAPLQLLQDDAGAVVSAASPTQVTQRGAAGEDVDDGNNAAGGWTHVVVPAALDDDAAAAADADPLHRHGTGADAVGAAGDGDSSSDAASERFPFDVAPARRESLHTDLLSMTGHVDGGGGGGGGGDAGVGAGVVRVTPVMAAATFAAADGSASGTTGTTGAAVEEQLLRCELQRLLGLANECALYGLQRSLRGNGDGATGRSPKPASPIPTAASSVSLLKGAARCANDNKIGGGVSASEIGAESSSTPNSRGPTPQLSPHRPRPHEGGTGAASAGAHPTEPAAASAAGTPSASTSLPALGNSLPASTPARTRAAVAHVVSPPTASLDGASAAATEASAAAPAALSAPPGSQRRPTRRTPPSAPAKRANRRKPLPAASGAGEHAAVLLQHELLLTRRAELEADQAHGRDIDGACAMLQRLRPLREQLMELDICHGRQRSRALAAALAGHGGGEAATHRRTPRGTGGPGDPLLLTRGPSPGRGSAMGAGALTVGDAAETKAVAAAMAAAALTREAATADAAGRSHMPQAVLQRHRQLIYEEAARLDTLNRLDARRGYLEVLTQLAQRHVSTISWPAVSALLAEAQERLARETQQAVSSSPSAGGTAPPSGSPSRPWLPSLGKSSSSVSTTAPATPALPYGGLQHLIATHLGILELTQWPVQEVLQHLAALYHVPLSLLHEWIAEQQRRQSHSYNYEERFRAIDRTIVGRAVTADTVLRLTLHRCRRPPLAPLRSASRATTAAGGRRSELVMEGEGEGDEEEGLYFVRVRSTVHTASSTAVPLSSAGAAAMGGGGGDGSGDAMARSMFTLGGNQLASDSLSITGAAAASLTSSSSSSAKTLSFLGQTLVLHLRSPNFAGGAGKGDRAGLSPASREVESELGDWVLLVELLQAGTSPTLLASGELDLRLCGFNPYRPHANGGARARAQAVTIALKRKGYRSAELKATLEVL